MTSTCQKKRGSLISSSDKGSSCAANNSPLSQSTDISMRCFQLTALQRRHVQLARCELWQLRLLQLSPTCYSYDLLCSACFGTCSQCGQASSETVPKLRCICSSFHGLRHASANAIARRQVRKPLQHSLMVTSKAHGCPLCSLHDLRICYYCLGYVALQEVATEIQDRFASVI